MTTPVMLPVRFQPPLVNPSPTGLYAATQWVEESGPLRWLPDGVEFEVFNYGGGHGVWTAGWCAETDDLTADDVKRSPVRPEFPEPFTAMTVWAADECDMTRASRAEVETRAQQNLRMTEQTDAETAFAERLLADAGAPAAAADIVAAVGFLEGEFAKASTVGLIHASAELAASAAAAQLIVRSGSTLRTPLGHLWVFGGGYVDGLEDTMVATSPTFGWRSSVEPRATPELQYNQYRAVVERSLAIGYEAAVGAATIS